MTVAFYSTIANATLYGYCLVMPLDLFGLEQLARLFGFNYHSCYKQPARQLKTFFFLCQKHRYVCVYV